VRLRQWPATGTGEHLFGNDGCEPSARWTMRPHVVQLFADVQKKNNAEKMKMKWIENISFQQLLSPPLTKAGADRRERWTCSTMGPAGRERVLSPGIKYCPPPPGSVHLSIPPAHESAL